MSILLAAVPTSLDARLPDGPVHRLIFAVDIEGSTERTNPAKGELRRILYDCSTGRWRRPGSAPGTWSRSPIAATAC